MKNCKEILIFSTENLIPISEDPYFQSMSIVCMDKQNHSGRHQGGFWIDAFNKNTQEKGIKKFIFWD